MAKPRSLSQGRVVSITARRDEAKGEEAFLGLLHANIADNPGRIEPIPASLFGRMERLRAKAEANRARAELLEG
ncbi:AbrB/MazE/SpoVT family DNA-binding domain-containing protein [Azotobacter beijerinckii]|uniref:hypothetical protein n=1 Tax=Azotobacter beijerinckii TaxID=170623 RepID=UPI0029538D18|nr:hypothetical protein [Azotobacter beijerinckii]MDV7209901.1 hypothetical protein [Azotobacter beijerinckii]